MQERVKIFHAKRDSSVYSIRACIHLSSLRVCMCMCVCVCVCIHIIYTTYTQGCAHTCLLLFMNRLACVYVLTYILYTYTHQLVCACVCVYTLSFQTGLRLIPIQTCSYKSLQCETTHPTHLRPTVQVPYSKLSC